MCKYCATYPNKHTHTYIYIYTHIVVYTNPTGGDALQDYVTFFYYYSQAFLKRLAEPNVGDILSSYPGPVLAFHCKSLCVACRRNLNICVQIYINKSCEGHVPLEQGPYMHTFFHYIYTYTYISLHRINSTNGAHCNIYLYPTRDILPFVPLLKTAFPSLSQPHLNRLLNLDS